MKRDKIITNIILVALYGVASFPSLFFLLLIVTHWSEMTWSQAGVFLGPASLFGVMPIAVFLLTSEREMSL